VGDIIRREYTLDFYASTIAYFTGPEGGYVEGRDFFVCPYDWRKDIRSIAYGSLANTLESCISTALARNPGAGQVNILAHSMGGLVARAYLADPGRAARVHRLVTLGSPFLGAPKMALALVDKLCFAEWLGLCFTNTDVLHELIQNYPAGYQIAPGEGYFNVYPRGYIRRDRDADGDGRPDGYLDVQASYGILERRNPTLAQEARLYQSGAGAWANGGTNGAEVFVFAGDQHASIGTLVEYEQRPWYNPWAAPRIAYRTEVVNGDGTVPLRSADMRYPPGAVDLSGGAAVYYFNLEHGELPKNPVALGLAASIFDTVGPVDPELLLEGVQNETAEMQTVAPHTEPLPLNGVYVSVDGPAAVDVVDEAGRTVQSQEPGMSAENLSQAAAITGASLTELGSAKFIFLPAGGQYTLRLAGEAAGRVEIRLQAILADEVAGTALYTALPVAENSRAELKITTAAAASAFSLDLDGDGAFEASYPPSAVLDARESLDITPPQLSLRFSGALGPDGRFSGPVTVAIEAQDEAGGSGLARVEYSLDGGKTSLEYRAPFQVDPQAVQVVLARAVDRAGSSALAERRVAPDKVFLPLLSSPN
jgi:pimeloyl-ACP methyl ester carboxylesterase